VRAPPRAQRGESLTARSRAAREPRWGRGSPTKPAAAEDRAQSQASAVRDHRARVGLQVRGL